MSFVPDVQGNASGVRGPSELRRVLDELGIGVDPDPTGVMRTEYTPGSYDPIEVCFRFPPDNAILAVEGTLVDLGEDEAAEDISLAVNLLNVEVGIYRFYVARGLQGTACVFVRIDILPAIGDGSWLQARELRQALTGLCTQKAVFEEPLLGIQRQGRSWRSIKDALRAMR